MTEPIGIWLIGARGDVAGLTMAGQLALAAGLTEPIGMVTAQPALGSLELAALEHIRFGGHDIRTTPLVDGLRALARDAGVPSQPILDRIAPQLAAIEPAIKDGIRVDELAPDQAAERIRHDLATFREQLGRAVVVHVASTEAPLSRQPWFEEPAALFERIRRGAVGDIPPSVLYAWAAIDLGLPYVNFTPSPGACCPALEQLARERGVPLAGRDGKTGETLLKSVLAPMFAARGLRVASWTGLNLLGNRDGLSLQQPGAFASKSASKSGCLEELLGASIEEPPLVRIDYVQSLGDRKMAMDVIDFRGFLGAEMMLTFTWRASDSALAAPLVLDLARLIDLAARRGESGPIGAFASFFKDPIGATRHDFQGQYEALLAWAAR